MTVHHCKRITLRSLLVASLSVLLAACATNPNYEEGKRLLGERQFEPAIERLEQAVREEPRNARFRADLMLARSDAMSRLIAAAAAERAAGYFDNAMLLYQRAGALEPGSARVKALIDEMTRDRRHAEVLRAAQEQLKRGEVDAASERVRVVLAENPGNPKAIELRQQIELTLNRAALGVPALGSQYRKPVTLEFRDAPLRSVFDALSRSTGINFFFDRDVKTDARTTILARQTPLEDALDTILATNQLEKKALNANTLLIYPATPAKLKEYQELIVRGFHLSGADPKLTQTLLKTLLKIREVVIDEKQKLVVVRDTPEAVRLAEKLIALHDTGDPEVMLELEVLEIRRSRLLDLGIQWPDQLTLTPLPSTGSTLTLGDLRNLNQDRIGASIASTILNLKKQDGDVNLLANPRVRARNREKARILIGDRVPVITSTATATGFVSQNVQYLDIGLKLEVEPDIQFEAEVGIKVSLEVSSITREILTSSGVLTYQLGTRTAATALRLRDGETQILAGLLSDEERQTANRVPGLGDVPIVGRLFGSQRDERQKTEIVLAITPRILRPLVRPEAGVSEFWSGTEAMLRSRPLALRSELPGSSPTLASISAVPAVSPGAAILRLSGPSAVKAGAELQVEVFLQGGGTLRTLPMQIGFDPGALELIGVRNPRASDDPASKLRLTSSVDQGTGRVALMVTYAEGAGRVENEPIATLTFRARSAGAASNIDVLLVAARDASSAVNIALPAPHLVTVSP